MSYRDFTNDIKDEIKKVYLLYGQESYLLDKAKELLKEKVVTAFPELNYIALDGENLTLEQLQNACETFPFGCEKKLVVVRQPAFLKKAGSRNEDEQEEGSEENTKEERSSRDSGELKRYLELIGEVPDFCCLLLLYYGELGKSKKISDAVKKCGEVFEFKKVQREELTKWVKNYFSKYGKKIGFREIDYFINSSGYLDKNSEKTLYDLANEINKVAAFAGAAEDITMEHLDSIMPKSLENDIFKLINNAAEKNVSVSLRVMNDLLMQGEEIFAILAMMTKQIRTMIAVLELNQKGLDAKGAAAKLKVHEFYAKNCLNYGRKIGMQGLIRGLNNCVSAEMNVKSGELDKRLAIEMLIVNMFQ